MPVIFRPSALHHPPPLPGHQSPRVVYKYIGWKKPKVITLFHIPSLLAPTPLITILTNNISCVGVLPGKSFLLSPTRYSLLASHPELNCGSLGLIGDSFYQPWPSDPTAHSAGYHHTAASKDPDGTRKIIESDRWIAFHRHTSEPTCQ
jgi:hypothetical protein